MKLTALDRKPPNKTVGNAGPALHAFDDTRDPGFFFSAGAHMALLSRLEQRLDQLSQTSTLVWGEPGSGKTYLRSKLFAALDSTRFARVSIENSLLDFDQLLLEIISQLSGRRALARNLPDRYARISEFKRILSQRVVQTGRRVVLLFDESQGYPPETLDQVRQLANTSSGRQGIISCVFFGNHAIETDLHELPELTWRTGPALDVGHLTADESRSYVNHRLSIAGSDLALAWSNETWQRLHDASQGLPGRINRLMRECIEIAGDKGGPVDDAVFASVLASGDQFSGEPGLFA